MKILNITESFVGFDEACIIDENFDKYIDNNLDDYEVLLVTVKQACKITNYGRTKIFSLMASGVLERRKEGRSTRITMRSIRKLAGE